MGAEGWWLRTAKALDRLGNAMTNGEDSETISHRVARAQARGVWWGGGAAKFVNWVMRDPQHCASVLVHPNRADAQIPLNAPLAGDADPTP